VRLSGYRGIRDNGSPPRRSVQEVTHTEAKYKPIAFGVLSPGGLLCGERWVSLAQPIAPLLHWALRVFATVTGMLASGLHYFPVTLPFLLVLIACSLSWLACLPCGCCANASISMGIGLGSLLAILSLSLLGSYINIPVAYLPERRPPPPDEISSSASPT